MQDVTIGLAFIAGLLSFVSPCVLPLVPAYIGYMGGRATRNVALETASKTKPSGGAVQRANMLIHGLAFVLGFTLVFVSIGLMTTALVGVVGSSVNVLTEIIGRVGGMIIIIFGLHFMGALRKFFNWLKKRPSLLGVIPATVMMLVLISALILWAFVTLIVALPVLFAYILWLVLGGAFTQSEKFWSNTISNLENMMYADTRRDMSERQTGGLGGSFIMGVVFSAGWTPCIGPLLGTILTVAAQTGEVTQAIPMLTAYSLGLGIPFMITAVLMEGAQAILRRLQRYMAKIEFISGSLLVIIGIMVASGNLQSLSANISPEQADLSFRIEECGIGFVRGDMSFGQAQDCLGGTLHPVALGQSAAGTLNAENTRVDYLVELDEPTVIDVELSRVETVFPAQVTIYDDAGTVVASGNEVIQVDDRRYVLLHAVELPAGRYTVALSQDATEEATFRLKVRESEPIEAVQEEASLPTVGSITDLASASGEAVGLEVGNRAPDFTITTIEGETLSLSDLRGEVVLLNFWGTWCGPCRREMPEFQEAYETHRDDGFTILALAILREDTEADVLQFRDDFGLTFPITIDEGERITDSYNIVSQPSTLILDTDGVIIYRNFGITLASQISDILEEALEG